MLAEPVQSFGTGRKPAGAVKSVVQKKAVDYVATVVKMLEVRTV